MPPLTLEGHTLGEKHKNFNKLVKNAIADKQLTLTKINPEDTDIENLLKIDAACKTKNIDYIIDVFKCNDMLYVSKAIKQSTWLLNEKHAHIINPEYLHTKLFPYMLTQAVNKLLLNIRLNLKDEKRVESFYNYLKDNNDATKWLLNCSIPFTENELQNQKISLQLFKRLCRRSVVFLKYYTKVEGRYDWQALQAVMFFLKTNTEEYMNIIDASKSYCIPNFGKLHTEIVMKKMPNKILDNFEKYVNSVDIATVAKHIKKEEIKDFLYKQSKNQNIKYFFSNYDNLKHFVKNMSKEDRFEFVKKTYIEKSDAARDSSVQPLSSCARALDCCVLPSCTSNSYNWYQYAPFSVAFVEIKKLIRAESSPAERNAMLSVLITCARKNPENTKILLQHYFDKHRNEPFKFKVQFVNNLISQTNTFNFDSETWSILDKLFYSMEVYSESENNVQTCLKSIILYKCVHNEDVPEIVTKKFIFDTLKKSRSKLNEEQKERVFNYLLKTVSDKLQAKKLQNDSDFDGGVILLKYALNLLIDWKKDLKDHAFLIEKLREFVKYKAGDVTKLKEDNELESLFNLKKSWRRLMFEESIIMCRNEKVCLNALKHDPDMLERHEEVIDSLRTNPAISLRRLLAKLRVYYIETLAQQWIEKYMNILNNTTGHKAILKGLITLLPQKELREIAKKYVPQDYKIEWDDQFDQIEWNIRKNIASNLYIARPMVPFEVLLWYAKGDYLQFVVPSLNSISHNLSKVEGKNQIAKLLEAPVSLQKYGIHLAFIKLEFDELKPIFENIWRTTKNSTIRTNLFSHTFNMLCKVKDENVAKELWELLSTFIDNLTAEENKNIFIKLGQVEKVHKSVQGEFYKKSFGFLSTLPPSANCETHLNKLIDFAPNIMDTLDVEFVANKLLSPIEEKITKPRNEFIDVMSAFILHGNSEEEQCERFENVLVPGLKHAFNSWDTVKDDEYTVRENFQSLLRSLTWDFRRFVTIKKIVPPIKLFEAILSIMEEKLPIEDNYIIYTTWKITTEYVKLVAEEKYMFNDSKIDNIPTSEFESNWMPEDAESIWQELHIKISPTFGPVIAKILKEDTEKYFPTIYSLFTEALNKVFSHLKFQRNLLEMETLKYMVLNEDYVPSYIVVCEELPKYGDDEDKKKRVEVRNILSAHPSKEVRMHYQKAFGAMPDTLRES